MMIELMITLLFLLVFYRMNVELIGIYLMTNMELYTHYGYDKWFYTF